MKTRDAKIAAALISGRLVREIASDEGVSERQVFRILAKTEVKEELERATSELARTAGLVVRSGARAAAKGLVEMASGSVPASSARTAACLGVLNTAAKMTELEDLGRRLEALERTIAAAPKPNGGRPWQ